MGCLSLQFKISLQRREVLNFNERPGMSFYVVYIPITPIFYCLREVAVVGRNKLEHAHYIRFNVVKRAQ